MKKQPRHGLSLIEILVVIAIILVLLGLLLPVQANMRRSARMVVCQSNLKGIASAFRHYANDNRSYLPDETIEHIWFVIMAEYGLENVDVLQCPADTDSFAIGLSYSWRNSMEVEFVQQSLAGKSLDMISTSSSLVMNFDAIPGWHTESDIQVAVVDASVRLMPADEFQQNMALPVQ